MLTIKHTIRCDQFPCPEAFEQEYQHITIAGQIPLPQVPGGWRFHPEHGFLCPLHELKVVPKEKSDARPHAKPVAHSVS